MASRAAREAARRAGRAAFTTEPPERRTPHACPFELGTEERVEWLAGFSEALGEEPDRSSLADQIKAAQKAAQT